MKVCLVYDCLAPWTVGGQEQWFRVLTETAVAAGHEVTYLTRRQWEDDAPPDVPGVQVVAVSRREPLYGADGNRRTGPPLRFGAGVGAHLARHRDAYDVVHTCGFPYFHLPALRAALAGTRTPVFVDWPEVWSDDYWRTYVGGPVSVVARRVQRAAVRLTPHALAFSDRYAGRLVELGVEPLRLGGLGPDRLTRESAPAQEPPQVVFAGRHIREKRAVLAVQAVVAARRLPGLEQLTAVVAGDGPERAHVQREAARTTGVSVPGFLPTDQLDAAVRSALCLVHPSSREGFGMVVLEAASVGTPVVVVDGPDNAAVELVEPGVNGEVAADASPQAVAAAISRVYEQGAALRESTALWYAQRAAELSARWTAERVLEVYERALARRT